MSTPQGNPPGSENDQEPRAGSAGEGVQPYAAPEGPQAEEKAPSSMGEPEPEHVEAATHAPKKK